MTNNWVQFPKRFPIGRLFTDYKVLSSERIQGLSKLVVIHLISEILPKFRLSRRTVSAIKRRTDRSFSFRLFHIDRKVNGGQLASSLVYLLKKLTQRRLGNSACNLQSQKI